MKMPVETLERLSFRSKRVAALEMNLEQLRRESETTRRQWWSEIEQNRAEYGSMQYDADAFVESNFALARLKLVTAFLENGEAAPQGHGFRDEEISLVKEFEQYIVYDRLSVEDIRDFIRRGAEDDRGIVALAKRAAVSGYDRMYQLMEQADLPNDLALALQRIYHDRIKKMEAAAAEIKLSDVHRDIAAASGDGGFGKAVTAAEARLLERSYIDGVETALRRPVMDHKWRRIDRHDRLEQIVTELKAVKPLSPKGIKQSMPCGLGLTAAILSRGLIFRKPVLSLDVRVVSNYKELHLRGFDTAISFGELMRHVEEAVARSKGHPCVLVLAAPAGWDAESAAYVRDGKSLAHNISLALIGLKDRVAHYNAADERLKELLAYFEVKA